MRTAQFTLGTTTTESRPMTSYKSAIDASAKLGGLPSNGDAIKQEMKKTSVCISEGVKVCSSQTEANQNFKPTDPQEKAVKHRGSSHGNIMLWEVGKPSKYYETSHSVIHNPKGNPNEIRSFIPDNQKTFMRACHFPMGYEQNTKST